MPNMNRWVIAGHCGKDSETKYTAEGKAVTTFSVAVSEGKQDTKRTMWVNVTVFGDINIAKGQAVFVEGRYQDKEYTAKDGTTKRQISLIASEWNVWIPAKANKNKQDKDTDDDFIPEV
jgi:single-strand DNA-binding protein